MDELIHKAKPRRRFAIARNAEELARLVLDELNDYANLVAQEILNPKGSQ